MIKIIILGCTFGFYVTFIALSLFGAPL